MAPPLDTYARWAATVLGERPFPDRPVVCIQGLGFVGAAMAAAVASAPGPAFNVLGVDLPTAEGSRRAAALNQGRFPFPTADEALKKAVAQARERGNLAAVADPRAFALASTIVIDIPLDVDVSVQPPTCRLEGFKAGIREVGRHARPGTLIVVETTVPPGTTEKVVVPELRAAAIARGLPPDAFLVAHSYERVMPGRDYLASIVSFWRVYAGATPRAADACGEFLSRIIDVARFPLRRLKSPTASEMGKVLENSYRAATIALMEEWGRFAERIGVDLFEVVDSIRVRPTHANLRQPGFGVGGYCLTKDPLFAAIGAREMFSQPDLQFPFADLAVSLNQRMPLVSLDHLDRLLGGVSGKSILVLGVSYRPDVGDTRFSPTEVFAREALRRGAKLSYHDPLAEEWPETGFPILKALPDPSGFDALAFTTAHDEYRAIDFRRWLGAARPLILDANRVLTDAQLDHARSQGCRLFSIGRGS